MSNERFQAKNFFQLNGGLNTELNELNFQDGFTIDEANYELLIDGSRRRRKGLAAESGAGTAKTVDTLGSGYANQAYLWENAGGDPDKKFMVFRTGDYLYFATADETISDGWYSGNGSFVNLNAYRTDDATDALCQKGSVSFSQGRGHLFVSGQYIYPFYVVYSATADDFTAKRIEVRIRDYTTIEDGLGVKTEPTDATIPADHRYNLRNRGWPEDRISAYKTDQSKWPARNSVWYKGYKRTSDTTVGAGAVNPDDGTKSWDSAKLDAEVFGSSEAPTGALYLDVFDTTGAFGNEDPGSVIQITGHTYAAGVHTLTITGHGRSPTDEIVIDGNSFTYDASEGGDIVEYLGTLNGTRTVASAPDANTITIAYTLPLYDSNFSSTDYGTADTSGSPLTRSTGTDHGDSFKALAFHDGRIFYAGMLNSEFNDYIIFSQVADTPEKYRKCYQEADPTDENFNALTPADGGYMVIPGMGGVLAMASVRNSLIVLAKSGVWEVSGGQRGVFTADGYSVRKLSANGASSPYGFEVVEDSLVYAGPGGIFVIAPNQYTGLLEVTSVSEFTVQTLWNQVPDAEQARVQIVYDSALKRVYMMWGPNGTKIGINTMLIYDARAQAWFQYTFNSDATDSPVDLTDNVLLTGFALANADDTSDNKKMKFIYEASTTTVQVADFDQTGFNDWDGTNGPLPYMVFGEDNVGDHQSRRQAPVVTVYSKRTETKWTSSGGGYTPDNPSSTLLTAFWDWSDAVQWTTTSKTDQEPWDGTASTTTPSVSGKIGKQQEVYRNVRNYVPYGDATSEVTGYPVVVTRNKIRGRGRALRLRFDGATDKDSHILGYTMNYKVPRRNNV